MLYALYKNLQTIATSAGKLANEMDFRFLSKSAQAFVGWF